MEEDDDAEAVEVVIVAVDFMDKSRVSSLLLHSDLKMRTNNTLKIRVRT